MNVVFEIMLTSFYNSCLLNFCVLLLNACGCLLNVVIIIIVIVVIVVIGVVIGVVIVVVIIVVTLDIAAVAESLWLFTYCLFNVV